MTANNAKPQVHQFVPMLDYGDAIGNHALALRKFLRKKGHQSEIFVWRAGRGMRKYCRNYLDYPRWSSPNNVVIYHFGVSSPITGFFLKVRDRKVIIYHNITPEIFFEGISDKIYFILRKGRQELAGIAGRIDLAIAVSEYNREELERIGCKKTVTLPLLIDFGRYEVPAASSVTENYRDDKTNIIFVGRISPNKKQEDVIRVFSIYKKYINNRSRLFIIGQNHQVPQYNLVLKRLVDALGVEDVHLTGGVSQAELNAYYSIADAFLCMSEHEGFCIPILECMHFGVPVLAYKSSAIADTLHGSGILFTKKDFARIAEVMDIVVTDKDLKEHIIESQRERLGRFRPEEVEEEYMNTLRELLN